MEWQFTLERIGQAGEGAIKDPWIQPGKAKANRVEENRVDAEADHTTAGLESFVDEPRTLTKQINYQSVLRRELTHVVAYRSHRLVRAIVG